MSDIDRGFRDYDPEDSYDATDPINDRIDVLERVIDSLRDNRDDRFDGRRRDLLRVLDNLDREDLNRRQARRAQRLREDAEAL